MAVCLECHAEMNQTEAACPQCGSDFSDSEESWHDLLLRKSSLADIFRLLSVLGLPLALAYYFVPAVIAIGPNHPHREVDGMFALLLGLCFYFCGWALSDAAPLCSRIFNAVGIIALATWPMFLF